MRADEIDTHPLVVAAQRLAADLLGPQAAEVDAGRVPRSHLAALGRAGVLGMSAPVDAGGTEAPAPVARRVNEVLAGADASTWFVQAQHHSPVRALVAAGGRHPLLGELAAGRRVAGIAFAHLRRWPSRPVTATRVEGGWRLDGTAPWYTGWGLNDVALLAGATADGRVVFGLSGARASAHLQPSAPMRLAALQSTCTVSLRLEGLQISDPDVVSIRPIEHWAEDDARPTVNPNPAVFGITLAALRLLAEHGERAGEPAATDAANRIGTQVEKVRAEAYRMIDEMDPDAEEPRRLLLRAAAHRLMVEATTALVVAGAGRALTAASPAQRLAREALFLLVQAQTSPARAASLAYWGTGTGTGTGTGEAGAGPLSG